VVRIFSPEYNRMVEAQVTDRFGRYGFLVDDNIYYVTANKEGYQEHKGKNVDLTDKRAEDIIDQNIYLSSQDEQNMNQPISPILPNQPKPEQINSQIKGISQIDGEEKNE